MIELKITSSNFKTTFGQKRTALSSALNRTLISAESQGNCKCCTVDMIELKITSANFKTTFGQKQASLSSALNRTFTSAKSQGNEKDMLFSVIPADRAEGSAAACVYHHH